MFFELCFVLLLALLAFLVVWTRSPFMSLMYSVMLFVNASVVLAMLGFSFFALVNMLVYVGALAVLFLFVIMLLEIPSTELRAYYRGWSTLAFLGILASRLLSNFIDFGNSSSDKGSALLYYSYTPTFESLSAVGHAFYVRYADLLILNSFVLTIALFGALVLAHTRS